MNITIIDDHFVSRVGINHLLRENFKSISIQESKHEARFPEKLFAKNTDLIMIGVTNDDQSNLRTWEQILALKQAPPVIIYCSQIKYYQVMKFLTEGAKGILFKTQEPEEFIICVKDVLDGKRYICHEVLLMIADQAIGGRDKFNDSLSAREMLIAEQLKTGQSTSAIAQELKLTLSTVSSSKTKIFKKLGVKNILELREIMNSGIVQ